MAGGAAVSMARELSFLRLLTRRKLLPYDGNSNRLRALWWPA